MPGARPRWQRSRHSNMNKQQLEYWVLRVVDQVQRGAHSEDSRVELKAEWPAHIDAARRIAAHANAARGEDVLWVIGLDETRGPIGADAIELSDWMAKVRKNFVDSVMPDVEDLNVNIDGKTLVALRFKTDRAPFVVRNPSYGKPDGGPVMYEVPWREGRSTRSATRHDLMRLLVPLTVLPEIECIRLDVHVMRHRQAGADDVLKWQVNGELYVVPATTALVTFPKHKTEMVLRKAGDEASLSLGNLGFYGSQGPVEVHQAGVAFTGPGTVSLSLVTTVDSTWGDLTTQSLSCTITLASAGATSLCRLDLTLVSQPLASDEVAAWRFSG